MKKLFNILLILLFSFLTMAVTGNWAKSYASPSFITQEEEESEGSMDTGEEEMGEEQKQSGEEEQNPSGEKGEEESEEKSEGTENYDWY